MSELQAQRGQLSEEEASLRSDAFAQRLVHKEAEPESRALIFSEKAELTVQFEQAEAHIKAQPIDQLEAAYEQSIRDKAEMNSIRDELTAALREAEDKLRVPPGLPKVSPGGPGDTPPSGGGTVTSPTEPHASGATRTSTSTKTLAVAGAPGGGGPRRPQWPVWGAR